MKNAIGFILSIDTFEQQCVVIKGMLKSPCLEDHMKTIGIDKSLSYRSSFEQKCLNNIKKKYQHAGKCDDQQNLKDIIDATMVYTTEKIIDEIPSLSMTKTTVKTKHWEITVSFHQNIRR